MLSKTDDSQGNHRTRTLPVLSRQLNSAAGPESLAGYRRCMQRWQAILVGIGGVVAVGFLDEDRIIVGSHSGVGVFDVHTGARIERTYDDDGNYNWYQGDPPSIRRPSAKGVRLIRAAGLWGGGLDQTTTDGWTCHRVDGGAVLSADAQPDFRIEDREEYRAQGFSPEGGAFVYATSPTVYLVTRRT
jgi:hypothetical protein